MKSEYWKLHPELAPKRRKGPEGKTLLTTAEDTKGTRLMLEEMDPTLALKAGTKGKETTLEARVADKEREAFFRMRIQVKTSIARCIVDPGCEKNLVAEELVTRLRLETTHKEPYKLEWCNGKGDMEITRQCKIKFAVTARFIDEVVCEVVPLDVCDVLLGNPYLWDRDAVYHR